MRDFGFDNSEHAWEMGNDDARIVDEGEGKPSLRLEDGAVWLRPAFGESALHLQTTIRSIAGDAFAGIAFYGRDARHYELVYACIPSEPASVPDGLQYDPVIGGSNTWQLFHGPCYQGPASLAPGRWFQLAVRVESGEVVVSVDGISGLHVTRLALDAPGRRIGLWAYKPALFTGLTVASSPGASLPSLHRGAPSGAIWRAAPTPIALDRCPRVEGGRDVWEDETGILNLNRVFDFEPGVSALVSASWDAPIPYAGHLRLGYSDRCRAWWNGTLIHEGEHRWDPPAQSDGRVCPDHLVPVSVCEGRNTLVANVTALEPFGWGVMATLDGRAVRV